MLEVATVALPRERSPVCAACGNAMPLPLGTVTGTTGRSRARSPSRDWTRPRPKALRKVVQHCSQYRKTEGATRRTYMREHTAVLLWHSGTKDCTKEPALPMLHTHCQLSAART